MSQSKKMLFVYNPFSGKGLVRSSLSNIIEIFTSSGYDILIHPTQGSLDGTRFVQEKASEFDRIACCGGDGTLDEVVTGMMRSGVSRPIVYLPAGSTNDFAASLGFPKGLIPTASAIAEKGTVFTCDLGRFNADYFVYVAAFGLLTEVSYETPQEMKNTLGHTAYLIEAMKRMGTWKSHHMTFTCDEFSGEGEYVYGMITNSDTVGGIKGLAGENVELNDGLFEVTLVQTPQTLMDWQEIITAILMHDSSSKRVVRFRTRRMVIESREPVAWTRDGENGGTHTRVEVENLPGALPIVICQEDTAVQK